MRGKFELSEVWEGYARARLEGDILWWVFNT